MNYIIDNEQCLVRTDSPLIQGWEECTKIETLKGYAEPKAFTVTPTVKWKGAKIPKKLWSQIIGTAVTFPHMEVVFSLYYNRKMQEWGVKCPEQKGRAASVQSIDEGYYHKPGFGLIGSIHTHPQMGAFWSPTDVADQSKVAGLHMVFGIKGDKLNSVLCTIFTPLGRYDQNIDDICEHVEFSDVHEPNPEWLEVIKSQALAEEEAIKCREQYNKPCVQQKHLYKDFPQAGQTAIYTMSPKPYKLGIDLSEIEAMTKTSDPELAATAKEALEQIGRFRASVAWLLDHDFGTLAEDLLDEALELVEGSYYGDDVEDNSDASLFEMLSAEEGEDDLGLGFYDESQYSEIMQKYEAAYNKYKGSEG